MNSSIEQMGSLEEATFFLIITLGFIIWSAIRSIKNKNKDKGDKDNE